MAFSLRRRRDKTETPDGAKSINITEDLRDTIDEWGGFPFDGAYGMIYRRQPAVRTVVDFLARNIAQLTLRTYVRLDKDDRVELHDHPLAVLLRKPNPTTTRFRLMRSTVADRAIYNRAYWLKIDAPARAVVRIPPSRMLRRHIGSAIEYRIQGANNLDLPGYTPGQIVPRDRLVVFAGYTPDANWNDEDGVPPMETLRRALAEEYEVQRHQEHYWKNAARREGVIERPLEAPEWSPEARQRFRIDHENVMSGRANAGRTEILEEGMHWVDSSFSPKESEYIAGRQLFRDEVSLVYGINPQLFKGESANANIESFHRFLYQDTLGPELTDIQEVVELELLPEMEAPAAFASLRGRTYCAFDLDAKLKGNPEQQAQTYSTAVGVPYMAVNEGRSRSGLARIDDAEFDVPIKPLNVMYGGQSAVTMPTEVPTPAGPKSKSKAKSAPAGALRRRNEAAATHAELFRRYFRAQQKAVKAKAATFEMDRWNTKLTGELYAARVALATRTGKLAATQIGGTYDEARTLAYLSEGARREAERVNAQTAAALEAAEDDDAVAALFEEATSSRSAYLGMSTAVEVINFARNEAARQSSAADGRARTKTWVVTSDNSRHPEMDGETVGLDETFSNGAAWPGDASAGEDQVAGCQCLLELN